MKKQYAAIAAVMAAALAISACSSKPAETTTAAATETTAEAVADAGEETTFFYGFITLIEDNVITVTDEDTSEAKFDVSDADLIGAETLLQGDEVEVMFYGEQSEDVTKAASVSILESAAEAEEADAEADAEITGTVESADGETLTLKTEDGSQKFNFKIANQVTKDGVKAGVEADVTYYGDFDDPDALPVVTQIVTEDARDSEDAQVLALSGTVAEVEDNYLVLDTADPENTYFNFGGEEGMFDSLKVGDEVTVTYEGSLTAKMIQATSVK